MTSDENVYKDRRQKTEALIKTIREKYAGANEPASMRDVSNIYAVLMAQHDALLAVHSLLAKAIPSQAMSIEALSAIQSILLSSNTYREGLLSLPDEGESGGTKNVE